VRLGADGNMSAHCGDRAAIVPEGWTGIGRAIATSPPHSGLIRSASFWKRSASRGHQGPTTRLSSFTRNIKLAMEIAERLDFGWMSRSTFL
jgi:hypothetical protein